MAAKGKVVSLPSAQQKRVIIDLEVTHATEGVIHFYLTVEDLIKQLNDYLHTLTIARGIKNGVNSVADPVVQYVRDNNPWVKDLPTDVALSFADRHYASMKETATNEAAMLALFSSKRNDALFMKPTELDPNEINATESTPGSINLPAIKRDMRFPVESRLVRVYEILFSDNDFRRTLDDIMLQINDSVQALSGGVVETSKEGFRS